MKYIDSRVEFTLLDTYTTLYFETADGVSYRTDLGGVSWERLYGNSWEPVFLEEEDQCKDAFNRYMKGQNEKP